MLERWWIGPILVLYTSQTEKVKNDRFYLKKLTFSSHILKLTFFWLFTNKMLTFGWLFLTFFYFQKSWKSQMMSTKSHRKSEKDSKSQKNLPENLKNITCFFDIIWQVLLSFRKTKKIYKYKFFIVFHRWHTVITRRHYKWSWLRIWTHDIFSIFWNFF